jgi:hypothetical protein
MWLSVLAGALLRTLAVQACAVPPPCAGVTCAAACPRDAHRDASGRCACAQDSVLVLGACVPPAVGDAYCGPAERMGKDGCSSRACGASERLDVVTGQCVAATSLSGAPEACSAGAVTLASAGHAFCAPREATCPRGTHRDGVRCARPPGCPPGALPEGSGCRPIVSFASAPGRAPTVDVGAWVALVIGPGGGHGSDDLCSRLARRPEAFGVPRGETRMVTVRVALEIPDQDLSRVSATVSEGPLRSSPNSGAAATESREADAAGPEAGTASAEAHTASAEARTAGAESASWLPAGAEVAETAVGTLIEPLRGLGGESSCAAVEAVVFCPVSGS